MKTKYTLKIKEFRKIILGIKSTGGCEIVSQIKVYHFVCSELEFGNRVMLKKTSVPQKEPKLYLVAARLMQVWFQARVI